jgi:hypothetical protein
LFIFSPYPINSEGQPQILARELTHSYLKTDKEVGDIDVVASNRVYFRFMDIGAKSGGHTKVVKESLHVFHVRYYWF